MSKAVPVSNEVQQYRDKVKKQAEDLVFGQFPNIILELNTLLDTDMFTFCDDLAFIHEDLNIPITPVPAVNNHEMNVLAKKRKLSEEVDGCCVPPVAKIHIPLVSGDTVTVNKRVSEVIDIVKPKIVQLIRHTNMLKMWVAYLIPKIEDGNNFGVSIQEETLNEIRCIETEGAGYSEHAARYFSMRAKVLTKVAKYPQIDDYRRTIKELDEKEYVYLKLILHEIRNHYSTLHDIITKNIEKIKKPRSMNSGSLY